MTAIIVLKLTERQNEAVELQKILTEFGCRIRTRIGLHHGTGEACNPNGIIVLDVAGDPHPLADKLKTLWEVHLIRFNQ